MALTVAKAAAMLLERLTVDDVKGLIELLGREEWTPAEVLASLNTPQLTVLVGAMIATNWDHGAIHHFVDRLTQRCDDEFAHLCEPEPESPPEPETQPHTLSDGAELERDSIRDLTTRIHAFYDAAGMGGGLMFVGRCTSAVRWIFPPTVGLRREGAEVRIDINEENTGRTIAFLSRMQRCATDVLDWANKTRAVIEAKLLEHGMVIEREDKPIGCVRDAEDGGTGHLDS